jgi:hypothetical protein
MPTIAAHESLAVSVVASQSLVPPLALGEKHFAKVVSNVSGTLRFRCVDLDISQRMLGHHGTCTAANW